MCSCTTSLKPSVHSEISKKGRTIIAVSQSLDDIKKLCQRALLMDKGMQIIEGDVDGDRKLQVPESRLAVFG